MKLDPKELEETKALLPPHLHRWIEYVPTPEPDEEPPVEAKQGRMVKTPEESLLELLYDDSEG